MSKLIRVHAQCLRPVSTSYFLFMKVGCTCPEHGRIYVEDTVKVPEGRVNYESIGY